MLVDHPICSVLQDEKLDYGELDAAPADAGKSMEDYLLEYFNNLGDQNSKMGILSLKGLNSAVNNYINKSDRWVT